MPIPLSARTAPADAFLIFGGRQADPISFSTYRHAWWRLLQLRERDGMAAVMRRPSSLPMVERAAR